MASDATSRRLGQRRSSGVGSSVHLIEMASDGPVTEYGVTSQPGVAERVEAGPSNGLWRFLSEHRLGLQHLGI
jgi:hypothetical protein